MSFIEKLRQGDHKAFDRFILVIGIAEPLITLPQVWIVWVDRQTVGLSLITWLLYALASVAWGVYGWLIKDKPLMITSVLWAATEATVALGVLVR